MYNEQIQNRVEQPVQTAPNSAAPAEPSLFTQPDVLDFINCRKLARFVAPFGPELRAANLTVPDPNDLNGHDTFWFARFFANPNLPENIRKALMTLETAADPTNEDRVYGILTRRFPQDNFGHLHPLDRALELWFNAREELAPFEPNPSAPPSPVSSNPLPVASGTEATQQENPKLEDGKTEITNPPSAVSPQIENHAALPATDAPVENGNTVAVETPIPAPAEPQVPIENQKSKIANPSDEEDYHPVWRHLGSPRPPRESDESAVQRLARLSKFDYDRVRKNEASKLQIRAEVLDSEVHRVRKEIEYQASVQETLSRVPTRQPWPEPISDAPALLHELAERYSRYLVLPLGASDVMSLFTTHTYVVNAFIQSPRLNLSSDHGGCGKTTAIDVLASLCQRPLQTESMSGAVLYRVVEQIQPTLLLDELDAWLPGNEEFRGLLNAGHKRDAVVFRCEGEGRISTFNAFAPVVLAGIGKLPPTLDDRSIHIPLVKALPGQITAHFDKTQLETEHILARKLARWGQDNFETLKNLRPDLPPEAYNRLGDNWRPLFAIAQVAGGDWPDRCLASFNQLMPSHEPSESASEAHGVTPSMLQEIRLSDIQKIFAETRTDKLPSRNLVISLLQMKNGPWLTANNGRPISERWLAIQLSRFNIAGVILRINGQRLRGYELSAFRAAPAHFNKEQT
jgi:hypothetical protein